MFRHRLALYLAAALVAVATAAPAQAQYNSAAGVNRPMRKVRVPYTDEVGQQRERTEVQAAPADPHGNAAGSQYDLAVDGAFAGQTIVVLQFYTGEGFDFHLPRAALKQKGFSVYRWSNGAPSAAQLAQALAKANQLWIISGSQRLLDASHLEVIKAFYKKGHGLYIWGDNAPYYADANYVAEALFDAKMLGNLMGNRVVTLQSRPRHAGLLPNHLLTTGLAHLYEGITIATIQPNQTLNPLLYGSANNLVAAFYEKGGRRAILDGGFTRLYRQWDTAGTARYVKNAAAWLANAERFGKLVVSSRTPGPGRPR